MAKDKNTSKKDQNAKTSLPPSGFKIIVREVWRDKVAFVSFCIIVAILLFTFVGSLFLNKSQVTEINIAEAYYAWGESGHVFGTDDGGRDILKLLIMGGRNSILIGLAVTVICEGVGLLVGLFAGYFGGVTDAIIMRIVDFIQILPQFPIIIVLTTVIPNYNAGTLVWLISMFGWTGSARYFRAFVLSQREREYVLASKTSGSSNLTIIFREVLPNITSAIIIEVVLAIAGNIGIETTLSFLGYGLPTTTPSLGTLIGFANDPVNVTTRPWLWLPATILLLIISLSINYVGRALQRAGDARQREN
ncbi:MULTISPECIES: ABC transporter permease [Lactobacillus]|jgi:peptide/nickel transport system permease protein|uniref:ABC transporter permease n=2 Tax=Lactobacillus johnsonii TaxID=33959 RepID=A0A9X7T632_LACJH|nr:MULTISPECIES: ABC transporter permease [Lactobacillus]AHA97162.1 peptide ABC transporter permease [Lactobacillus johnsonii N6.2]KOH02221.1 peptide ABC transporter permease [Lactobacillus johnsonii 16]MCR1916595.1 ABC transporter permease [Lactobacillus taiwanensis]MDE7049994.1 ABC transporter permease [Lactobacillus sp.]MDU6569749.1 ABC transporter permease [Lactobacillus johnsonii]